MSDESPIIREEMLSLLQAARRLPPGRRGKPVTLGCILRWVLKGAVAPNGSRVKLEAIRLGGRWLTSIEALERFAARLTPNLELDSDGEPTPPLRTPTMRQRASERAAAKLERIGI